jgi:hypothetical protein
MASALRGKAEMVGRVGGKKKGGMGGDDALFFTIRKTILPPYGEKAPGEQIAPYALYAVFQYPCDLFLRGRSV